jgi:hypothetical protein
LRLWAIHQIHKNKGFVELTTKTIQPGWRNKKEVSSMKRMKLVLAVITVMEMLVASAVPAMAKNNDGGHASGGLMGAAHNGGGHDTSRNVGTAHRGEAREGVFDTDFGTVNGEFGLAEFGLSDTLVSDPDDILAVVDRI